MESFTKDSSSENYHFEAREICQCDSGLKGIELTSKNELSLDEGNY